ncbi:MAG: hypothetical protein GY703_10640 [Gammaproteobacteria bacterium]|nr:hypothetical protein [Gammaproteobacteria bacterium]
MLFGGLAAGTVMFGGFSFQQIGLLHTTAGNAGFITGMYLVMVPIAGMLLGQSTSIQTWVGVILAFLGCGLMLAGMLVSQWPSRRDQTPVPRNAENPA